MRNHTFNLQLFADGENNNQAARSYQLEFKRLLQAVFKKQSYFADFFGGSIEAMDGIQENETAFYVKTSDIPCVCGTGYDKTATKAFGTGTGNSSRFGSRTVPPFRRRVVLLPPLPVTMGAESSDGEKKQVRFFANVICHEYRSY